jgi:outer membrane protein
MNNKTPKTMKHICTVLFLIGTLSSFAQKKWTLKECVDHVIENNISVKQVENNLLINDQDIIAAKGQFLPGAALNLSQNLNLGNVELFEGNFIDRTFHSSNVGLNLSQTVFNGFRNTNIYKQSLINREASVLELSRIKDDVSLNVVNAFLNVLFNKENLQTAKIQLEFSRNQIKQVSALVEAGVQPQANIYDAEATFSSDEQRFTVAQNNYDLALLTLSQLLQVPYKGFQVESLLIPIPSEKLIYNDVETVLNFALSNRSEIKIAEKNQQVAALSTELSKSGYYPSVSLGYGFNTGANFSNLSTSNSFFQQINDNKGHGFNLNISIPLFSRFQNKTAVAKSKIQEDNAKLNLDKTRLDLESNIQRAYTDAQAALKTFIASNKSLKARELSFNNARERYDIGALNAFELDQNRVQLVNAEANLINAKFDFVFKTKVLDFYMGNKIVE